MDIMETIREQVENNSVLLYMKGSPNQPQCGFSSQASQALMSCGEPFSYIDILANPEIRANLPEISDWPTFPQLFVAGELVGGLFYGNYPGGTGLMAGAVFGKLAGTSAATNRTS